MSCSLCLRLRHYVYWILMFSVCGTVAIGSSQTACYSTPNAAIESLKGGASLSPASQGRGYRVTGIQSDPVLGQRWVMIARCEHTEWPMLAVQTGGPNAGAALQANQMRAVPLPSISVVHVGDIVRLWKQEDLLQIEVAGVSEESGGLGETIRVRLLPRNPDGQWIPERFSGIVRGPSDVEMQP
jgi:hypothetical protein